jgi:hypothetical protein
MVKLTYIGKTKRHFNAGNETVTALPGQKEKEFGGGVADALLATGEFIRAEKKETEPAPSFVAKKNA